jgi:hypothetical protein
MGRHNLCISRNVVPQCYYEWWTGDYGDDTDSVSDVRYGDSMTEDDCELLYALLFAPLQIEIIFIGMIALHLAGVPI